MKFKAFICAAVASVTLVAATASAKAENVTILGGGVKGQAYQFAVGLTKILADGSDINATAQSSKGMVAQARLLERGDADFALPTSLAVWRRRPNHLRIKPNRQRSALLQAVIVRRPILGLVLRRGPTAHVFSYHAGFIQ